MRFSSRWNSDSSGSSEPDLRSATVRMRSVVVLPGLLALHAVGSAGEEHERRARGHDLAARLDPLRVLDLRLLGEVDLLAGDLLAQDGAVDHRHDVPAELAHELEARAVGIGELHEQAHGVVGGERLADGILGGGGVGHALGLAEAVGIDRAQELEGAGAARVRGRQDEAQPAGVGGQLAEVGDVLVARDGEHAFAHVVLAHDGECGLRLQLPALQREHVELAVAELARIGEHALHVLARAGRGRAAIVELRELELGGESRAEARVVGAVLAAGVDLAGAGRERQAGQRRGGSQRQSGGLGDGFRERRHVRVLLHRARRIWAAQDGVALMQDGGANRREKLPNCHAQTPDGSQGAPYLRFRAAATASSPPVASF